MRYLQLAHNEWDPATKTVAAEGAVHLRPRGPARPRRDQAAGRVAVPAARPGRPPWRSTSAGPAGLAFISSRPFGGTLVLDALWRRLGIDTVMAPAADRAASVTRAPSGCCSRWSRTGRWRRPRSWPPPTGSTADVHIDGLPETSDDACYRAMDWLHEIAEDLEREVF